ncbi:ABC transporter permease [Streptomyces clavuligerus]|uniref:L-arabinose transport system permease protein araH n=2 Tax=Streptomyces clavuligerus TaxID=1901 RepID=B5H2G5_STRCL|nr:ABC transporter permease [Streptomyces clavuligerus]ANW20975.1 ATPase [Streptomyces clavuligerus]AXU15593.1 ABC transporter permease [Streptomyces clavuligerus]EDY52761.1 L-arabinose transport system permease protein araH [Streptomyces clavuligerus]EFG05958.1 L-arabinose transport system permease protein araH [Streptomyces clavuligerus]MBY6305704.1 ABC transporter permease [Streptomyces clavuligerus]
MTGTTPTTTTAGRTGPAVSRLSLIRWSDLSLVPVVLVLMLIGFVVSPVFLTADNLIGVVQQSSELSLLVLGQALVLICGRMDLSLESTIGIAPVLAMWLVLPAEGGRFAGLDALPPWSAIPVCLLAGAAIGAVNGFLMLKLHVNGFIATLGMLTMLRGLHVGITEGKSITDVPESFRHLGKTDWFGAPAAVWICLALFTAGGLFLAYHRHGRALYAIGGNPEAARAAGIRTDRIVWAVLVAAGVLAAFAGILYTGHYGSVAATQGNGWIFQVFAAAVIGGISLKGGRGTLFGALTGVLTLQLVVNVMTLGGVPALWNQFLNGAIIIVALVISRYASGERQD